MRFIVGLILGAALIVGAAYVHDRTALDHTGRAKPMVNWDVVADNARSAANVMEAQWNRLVR